MGSKPIGTLILVIICLGFAAESFAESKQAIPRCLGRDERIRCFLDGLDWKTGRPYGEPAHQEPAHQVNVNEREITRTALLHAEAHRIKKATPPSENFMKVVSSQNPAGSVIMAAYQQESDRNTPIPIIKKHRKGMYVIDRTENVRLTAYNSLPEQTDSTPCLTANNFNVCEHDFEEIVAINGIALGTVVRFPDVFPDRYFTVEDRMNARYDSSYADIWMHNYDEAVALGAKWRRMEIYKKVADISDDPQ